jgi:malate dehydrogenase
MVEAVLGDTRRMMSAAAYLDGQYGIRNIHIGVPVIVGAGGIEEVCELTLDDDEAAELREAADTAREMVKQLETASNA